MHMLSKGMKKKPFGDDLCIMHPFTKSVLEFESAKLICYQMQLREQLVKRSLLLKVKLETWISHAVYIWVEYSEVPDSIWMY